VATRHGYRAFANIEDLKPHAQDLETLRMIASAAAALGLASHPSTR